ncbi:MULTISPECIES: DUF2946 domain-containing protein [unclassified Bradyrhizobium]|uniref:DUF2946 domain-containing protein n=2 Tax=unclassified Bradyrhizobium TaxID=2631580 RepID=UPI001FF9DD77|nr:MULTISPECIES: DUF2946 domain-containing protein [unclassified Bradyrhizobium]MCK1333064.1 DUF2946 domain-containing protein [Bradyrhizobium sp. CW9]MCK1481551.1 DUF2946 domain-containing protein [Bradyrhizobium sp. 193]MCK1495618.1 DUF2946 domain-containing protein [Bradyrhizobium sp. 188]MCK1570059.1 DUF2946 domain-containing protein [Bradyrhizobium sp. 173]MCK1575773.1 DUF2946 domain-containing protein [Bradyrhizobium sp. 174]
MRRADENWLNMRWFRVSARLNTWFALFALAMNFALSFGHVHAGQASERGSIVDALALPDHGKAQGHSNDSHPDYLCPICVASAALANGLASTPPATLLEFKQAAVDRRTAPPRLVVALRRAPFQSRGPPIS